MEAPSATRTSQLSALKGQELVFLAVPPNPHRYAHDGPHLLCVVRKPLAGGYDGNCGDADGDRDHLLYG